MKLLIVESPTKARTITKYLDKSYTVRASVGHVRDLPKSNKNAIDIEKGFKPHYEVLAGKEKVINEIKQLAKKADEVVIATDPDREGEAIAWHIKKACGLKDPKRAVFHEITKEAVEEALSKPRKIDAKLLHAQEARRVLDRLVGYDLSGLIWKKVRYGLSAGRVQSPALRIIMEREREIRAFKPEDYWVITANFNTKNKNKITLTCSQDPKTEKEAKRILDLAKKEDWEILAVKESEVKRSTRPPFITSTLQQTASSRFAFSPSQTMRLAQRLYEDGYITYMRTDSASLSRNAFSQIKKLVETEFGKEYLDLKNFKTKSKSAQEAHEAIRPTKFSIRDAGKNIQEKKLYDLIWARAVASQMASAKMLKTKVNANIRSKKIPDFSVVGSRLLFPGWLVADPAARGEDVELPKLELGESIKLKDIQSDAKQTKPPGRYTEAGLIKELEKREIGRPSTYASIIRTITDRGYVEKEDRSLNPTDTGEVVSDFLEKNFGEIISDSFTAEMEDELDEIAEGKRDYEKTLADFYKPFTRQIKNKEKMEKVTNLGDAPKKFKCPKCKNEMIIKLGKNGKFLSCADFPKCEGARTIEGKELAGPKETGEICPKCKGALVEREGKYGKFISCSNYPKCKFIKEDPGEIAKKKTGVICPDCKEEEIIERRGKFGAFYSCFGYPKCRFAIKACPTGKICKKCGSLMMEGTKTIPDRCSSKVCANHNPHKK